MPVRIVTIQPRSRAGAVALAAGIVVVGGVLVVLGAALLLTLAATAVVVGTGAVVWHRLAGGARRSPAGAPLARAGLDPRLEVHPEPREAVRPLPPAPDE